MSLKVKKKKKKRKQDKERHTERIKEESRGEECKPEGSDETHGGGKRREGKRRERRHPDILKPADSDAAHMPRVQSWNISQILGHTEDLLRIISHCSEA